MKKIISILIITIYAIGAYAVPEGWTVNSASFEYSLTLTGIVKVANTEIGAEGDMLAAFVYGECRGVTAASYVEAYDKYYFFLTAFSNEYTGDEVILKYYNKAQDSIYVGFSAITFKDGDNLGSASEPYFIEDGVVNYSLSISNNSIDENLPENTIIGELSAFKNDEETDFSFKQLNNANLFSIVDNRVFSKVSFNYEEQAAYSLKIVAYNTDSTEVFEDSLTININDVNEAFNLELTENTIEENNELGAVVGDFTTSSSSKSGINFILDTIADAKLFSIANGKLLANTVFDFETQSNYQIKVMAISVLNDTVKQSFVIEVLDANDAPYELSISNDTISENLPEGTFIGEFLASDQDADDKLVYTIAEGESSNLFEVVGDSLLTKAALDYELAPLHTLIVFASDKAGAQVSSTISIKVQDVFETSISSQEQLSFGVYPNPACNELTINTDTEIQKVVIYNTMGNMVMHSVSNSKVIDVSELKEGIYFVKVFSQTKTGVKQIVKY